MESISVFTALFAGFLSFASPCVLPLIPAYISYVSGVSIQDAKKEGSSFKRLLLNSIAFVIGFSIVFILLGASATYVGRLLAVYKRTFETIAGIIVVIFGLHTAQVIRIGFLAFEKKLKVNTKAPSFLGALLIGFAFSFGWTPCVGPILGAILIQASTYDTVWQGVVLLSVYSLGLGIPFILTAIALDRFFALFKKVRNYFGQIEIFAGLLITGIGLGLVFGTGLHAKYVMGVMAMSAGLVFISLSSLSFWSVLGVLVFAAAFGVLSGATIKIALLPPALLGIAGLLSLYMKGVRSNERVKKTQT